MIDLLCDVQPGLVERVTKLACPRDGGVLVVVGTRYLAGANFAECVPRRALETAHGTVFRSRAYRNAHWDAGVAVAEKTCALSHSHPAVFAQILAHEFGHAAVVIRDPDLHTYCAFLDLWINRASGGAVTRYHELAHERAFDAYGNWAAVEIFGADRFRAEMQELIASGRQDRERLEVVLSLPPEPRLDGLRAQVRAFAEPYRIGLEQLWAEEASRAAAVGSRSITQQASRPIKALWSEDLYA
jgi:hypothetical protein